MFLVLVFLLIHPSGKIRILSEEYPDKRHSLITLFSIFNDSGLNFIRMTTLHNKCILRGTSSHILVYHHLIHPPVMQGESHIDWLPINVTQGSNIDHFIGDLFQDAISRYNSTYYGYTEGYVLFTGHILETLEATKLYITKNTPVILFGKSQVIDEMGHDYGKVNETSTNAMTYFILGNVQSFPWRKTIATKDSCFSSYIFEMATRYNVITIDISSTVQAFHQVSKGLGMCNETTKPGQIQTLYETRLMPHGSVNVQMVRGYPGKLPLLTIFTTFRPLQYKFVIHANVIRNWALFMPNVIPVLFNINTDPELLKLALHYGWKVLPAPRLKSNILPYFKEMYWMAKKNFKSIFYGYCNGDILFTSGLIETLKTVTALKQDLGQILVIGQRNNFNFENQTIQTLAQVEELYRRKSKLFIVNAEDYFFMLNGDFPWDSLADIVIGRPVYDNYVVAQGLRHNVSVIDATQTMPALHQTGRDGNKAGHSGNLVQWNRKLIGPYVYKNGYTDKAQYVTRKINHQIEVYKKLQSNRNSSKSKGPEKWLQRIGISQDTLDQVSVS